jgi:hypothetical protein
MAAWWNEMSKNNKQIRLCQNVAAKHLGHPGNPLPAFAGTSPAAFGRGIHVVTAEDAVIRRRPIAPFGERLRRAIEILMGREPIRPRTARTRASDGWIARRSWPA